MSIAAMDQPVHHTAAHKGVRVPRADQPVTPLRVMVLCDLYLTSEAIRVALRHRPFELIGVGQPQRQVQPRQAARVVEDLHPHVGLLMQEMVDPLQIRDALKILREVDTIPWLVLTGSPQGPSWGAALEAGARAVLPMTIGLNQLADALVKVSSGTEIMPGHLRQDVLAQWLERDGEQRIREERLERLTPREMEVLQSLSAGHPVQEIADAGGVNIATVRSQVKAILRKLEVRSQLSAVAVLQQSVVPYRRVGH